MQRRAVIPDNGITDIPFMGVYIRLTGREIAQAVQDAIAFLWINALHIMRGVTKHERMTA